MMVQLLLNKSLYALIGPLNFPLQVYIDTNLLKFYEGSQGRVNIYKLSLNIFFHIFTKVGRALGQLSPSQ